MAVNVRDVTLISVSAVGTDFITSVFPRETRNTFRIAEIIGGLLTVQLARRSNPKAVGAGIMTGALVGFVEDTLRLRTDQLIRSQTNSPPFTVHPDYDVGYYVGHGVPMKVGDY